ncbi:MAG TPA: transglutaminase family protein [Thermomicrobiales bacterium]
MNGQRIDDLARKLAKATESRTNRRTFLRALGLGATAVTTGVSTISPEAGAAAPAAQATPATRSPGGPSLEDLAFDFAYDPELIFRFVADEVRYDAYPGVLRGAKGTLWGRAGNSADQALLLAEMLKAALVDVRFVVGELDEANAARLLESLTVEAAAARAHALEVLQLPAGDPSADPANLTPEQREAILKLPETRKELLNLARARLGEDLGMLAGALADAAVTLPAAELALPDRERIQHVWIQYRSGTEWIDLDPSIPGAEAGTAYATPTETLDALPDDLYHTVEFGVVAEVVSGGQPTRRPLLTHQARSADLVGVPISLIHVEPEPLQQLGITISSILGGGGLQWLPHLIVDEQIIRGEPMVFKTDSETGDLFGGDSATQEDTLAAWATIDIRPVDGEARHAERMIFDRVDPAARLAGTFDATAIPPIEMVTNEELGEVYPPLLTTMTIAVVGSLVPGSYYDQDYSIADTRADLANMAHGYHYARAGLEMELMDETGYRFYPNAPNVTMVTLTPTQIGDAEDGRLAATLDLVHQAVGAAPIAGASPAVHPSVVAGVLAHVAERATVGELVTVMPSPTPVSYISVGRLFDEARTAGIALQTLHPGTTPAGVDFSARAQALIEEALSAGYLVVVPERPVTLDGRALTGWWQVDPRTGETFDRMEMGGSQDSVEYMIMLGELFEGIYHLKKLAYCLVAAVGVIGGILMAIGAVSSTPGLVFTTASLPATAALCALAFVPAPV